MRERGLRGAMHSSRCSVHLPASTVVRQARRTAAKNKKSQPAPAPRPSPNLPGLMGFPPNALSQARAMGSQGCSVPPWVRGHQGHGPCPSQYQIGMQIEGPHGQPFDGSTGSSGLGIEAQFSGMHVMRERTDAPQHGHMMLPQHPNHQAYHHQFNHNPNEFWHNYPIANFPWNH